MKILGISAYYHDSAACLVSDGHIVAAAQEERFTRKKHDHRFPTEAVAYCLSAGGLSSSDLDAVAFYDKPILKFDRILETYLAVAPRGFGLFLKGLPLWLKRKLHLPREIADSLGGTVRGDFLFPSHHESHAASAFYPSPFQDAAILTIDGVGEWATATIGVGEGNRIRLLKELRFPHSLGLLFSAFTYFTGFKVNSGEYKLMGLAPYGEPRYADLIMRELIDLKEDGSFRMNMRYFGYCHLDRMTTAAMNDLLDGPPRSPESPLTQREMDIAASIQQVTEEIVLRMARHAHGLTGQKNLVLAGGVALNCVANGRVLREGPFERVWVQPAAGDAGGALGAALMVWHGVQGMPREVDPGDSQSGSLLGPSFSNDEIVSFLDSVGGKYETFADERDLTERVAGLLEEQRVVGHFAGRMEFGPRALGNRSILGDARSPEMQKVMNLKIKFRESFRPFAPAVLRDHASEVFELEANQDSPYMLLVVGVREERRRGIEEVRRAKGLDRLATIRSDVPAITHVDWSARVQTVDEVRFPRFHALLSAFERRTGCPVLINTSFNVRGEPIVGTPEEAYRCFMATDMDALVLENQVLLKEDQPKSAEVDRKKYLDTFDFD